MNRLVTTLIFLITGVYGEGYPNLQVYNQPWEVVDFELNPRQDGQKTRMYGQDFSCLNEPEEENTRPLSLLAAYLRQCLEIDDSTRWCVGEKLISSNREYGLHRQFIRDRKIVQVFGRSPKLQVVCHCGHSFQSFRSLAAIVVSLPGCCLDEPTAESLWRVFQDTQKGLVASGSTEVSKSFVYNQKELCVTQLETGGPMFNFGRGVASLDLRPPFLEVTLNPGDFCHSKLKELYMYTKDTEGKVVHEVRSLGASFNPREVTITGLIRTLGSNGCARVPPARSPREILRVLRGECTFQKKAELAYENGYIGLVIVDPKEMSFPYTMHGTTNKVQEIPTILLGQASSDAFDDQTEVTIEPFYLPTEARMQTKLRLQCPKNMEEFLATQTGCKLGDTVYFLTEPEEAPEEGTSFQGGVGSATILGFLHPGPLSAGGYIVGDLVEGNFIPWNDAYTSPHLRTSCVPAHLELSVTRSTFPGHGQVQDDRLIRSCDAMAWVASPAMCGHSSTQQQAARVRRTVCAPWQE